MTSVWPRLFITAFLLSGCAGRESDDASAELQEVLEEWIILGIRFGDRLPSVNGMRIKLPRVAQKRAG